MRFARTSLAIMVAATGLLAGSARTEAASPHHIDEYALQLQRQATSLIRELGFRYRHAPEFRHLMADASAVVRDAAHVHAVAHNSGNLAHLNADLSKLDASVHDLNELMDSIALHVGRCHCSGCGHFHGDIRPARRLINQMLDTLHHLQDDVRTALYHQQHYDDRHDGRVGRYGRSYRPAYPRWYGSSYGVRLGGNGWSVQFGGRSPY
jgi:hypothetical protein